MKRGFTVIEIVLAIAMVPISVIIGWLLIHAILPQSAVEWLARFVGTGQ